MSGIRLTELSCPGCGAPLRFSPGASLTTCPFCDASIAATARGRDVQLAAVEHRAVPFAVPREAFEQRLLTWLSEGDYTPDDIFSRAMMQEHTGLYIPCYQVRGSWSATFTAAAGFDSQETYVDMEQRANPDGTSTTVPVTKTRTRTDWRPMSGEASGTYELLCLASQRIPKEMHDFCEESARRAAGEAAPLRGDEFRAAAAEPFAIPLDEAWSARGVPQLHALVQADVRRRIPGEHARDVQVNSKNQHEAAIPLYHPAWLASFTYGEERFHLLLDGADPQRSWGRRPEDRERKARIDALFEPVKKAGLIWGIATLVGLFVFVIPGLLALAAGGIHVWTLYSAADKQKRAILDHSRQVRQQALAQLQRRESA